MVTYKESGIGTTAGLHESLYQNVNSSKSERIRSIKHFKVDTGTKLVHN